RYKSKVRYRRKTGHRQALTRVRITDILLDGASASTSSSTSTSTSGSSASTAAPEPQVNPAFVAETVPEGIAAAPAAGEATTTEAAGPSVTAEDEAAEDAATLADQNQG